MALVNGTNYDHIDFQAAAGGDVTRHKLQDTDGRALVSSTEASSTASAAHAAGSYFILSGVLYRATADIAQGGSIVTSGSGQNCEAVTVGGEVASLKTEFNANIALQKNAYVNLKDETYWKQGTVTATGTITDEHESSNIYTPMILTFAVNYSIHESQRLYLLKYKDGTFVSRTEIAPAGSPTGTVRFDSTFDSYRLMLIWRPTSVQKTLSEMIANMNYLESEYKTIQDQINEEVSGYIPLQKNAYVNLKDETYWKQGSITATGIITDNHEASSIYTPMILPFAVNYSIHGSQRLYLIKYKDGAFVSRTEIAPYGSPTGTVHFDSTFDSYRLMLIWWPASVEKTLSEMIANMNYLESEQKTIFDFLNKIACCYTGNKIAHYSVDDTYAVLKDLTDNASTYTSIFDNATLAALKSIHDDTGMCITLNTFNTVSTVSGYSIANVPEKADFKAEFQANKDWLKFAFHAESDTTDYSVDTGISTAYDTFVNAIYKLTGDYDCIDRITRLGYYGGTLENVRLIKNKTHGIIGLLCSDTSRDSYYLSADQNKQVQSKGMVIDAANELIMLKTITRNLGQTAQDEIKNNLCYQKYVELISHEYESRWITDCRAMCEWCKANGYVFAFPSLIFDVGQ